MNDWEQDYFRCFEKTAPKNYFRTGTKGMKKKKIITQLHKMTTSKKILWISWISFMVLIILKCCGLDVTDALTIVGGVLTSVVTGFYMWKSKCENREKIAYAAVKKIADKYGIESAISLVSEILKE